MVPCFAVLAVATLATACTAASAAPAAAPGDDDIKALIQRQSQEFSDASASGDRDTLARYLDDRVVFVDESGNVASKADVLGGTSPTPPGAHNALKQADFHVEVFGDTAVTSFRDLATFDFHGQVLHPVFLSTEVWHRSGDAWRMVSSQTLALQQDPPAVVLPAATLDDYVGTYTAGPDYVVKVTRNGDDLQTSVNNGTPGVMKAELRDVFFVPGAPRLRRIFQRDAQGHVTGYVSRREGFDIVLRRAA